VNRRLAAAACGLAAAGWAVAVPGVAACASAPYSHASQFISELGAHGAAHGGLVSLAGFAPTGVLVLAFLALADGLLPSARCVRAGLVCLGAVGLAYLVSAAFRCDPGCPGAGSLAQSSHNAFGLLEYVGASAGLLLLATALRSRACVAAALGVAVGLAAMLTPSLEPLRGVSQRVAEASIFGWIAATSMRLLRLEAGA
jgi:Protein of unknown function (DUF998)